MSRAVRLFSIFTLFAASLLLLPASAQETPPAAEKPAAPAARPAPAGTAAPAEEADAPPDLGENVSADNSVSFPVDI
jgi:uncharacterized membrane protein